MAPVATVNMSSDVHLGGRPLKNSPRKAYDAVGYEGYYGEEDGHEEWWQGQEYAGYDAGMGGGYYEAYSDHGEWDHFEVDLMEMVFNLDENLEPQEMKDMYKGFDVDQKSLFFILQDEDIDESSPQAWKSRPLKIHPEPAPRLERKDSMSLSPTSAGVQANVPGSVAASPDAGGSPLLNSPRIGPHSSPHLSDSPNREAGTPQRSEVGASNENTPGNASDAPGSQSPKIIISGLQLENLKKKMEDLKKKRSGGAGLMPMELPPASLSDNGSKEVSSEDARKKGKEQFPCISNCPGAHGLEYFRTPDDGWWCTVCETEYSKDSAFFGCRTCDYDECEKCARTPAKKKKKASEVAKTKSSKEASKESKESSAENSSQEQSPSPKRSSPPSTTKKSSKEKRKDASPPSRAATPPRSKKKKHKEDKHEDSRRKKQSETRRASSPDKADSKGRKASLAAAESKAQSEEGSSSEDQPKRRVTRENKLVPRGKRQSEEQEHWKPRSRQDASDDSPSPDRNSKTTGKALAAAVRNVAAGRRPTLRRAPAHERKAPSRTSRSRDRESSEEPPKKRASISKTSGTSMASRVEEPSQRSGGSTGSGPRGSPEAPRAATGPVGRAAGRGAGYGNDLLRRILQGNARGGPGREEPQRPVGRGRGAPVKEAPPPEERPPTPRERETTRAERAPPAGRSQLGSFGKALQQIATQGDRRRG